MKCLAAADYLLTGDKTILPALARRIDAVPGLREQVEQLGALMDEVIMRLSLTISTEQREHVLRQMRWSEITVGVPKAAGDQDCMVISLPQLYELIDAARGSECILCPKTEAQARACPLRKVLDAITVHDIPRVAGCSYRTFVIDGAEEPWELPPGKEEAK